MGASTSVRLYWANSFPRAWVSKGLEEEVSIIIVPGLREGAIPEGPRRTSRTILPLGSMVIITEQEAKAEDKGELSLAAVVFGHSYAAFWALVMSASWTIRWWPDLGRLEARL